MNALDPELLARLAAADARQPVPPGQSITPVTLRSRARRRVVTKLLVATIVVTALGLPLLFRSTHLPSDARLITQVDIATELRVLQARLGVLQQRAAEQRHAATERRARAIAAASAHELHFELADARATAALQHHVFTTAPETRR